MDEKFQILLGSKKNINSVNVNTYAKIELTNKVEEINEYNINNSLSASDVFDAEREASEIYRIYGRIEYLSLLNNLKNVDELPTLNDFFIPYFPNDPTLAYTSKTILNSFNFYLLAPSATGYTNITISGDNTYYIRDFEIIAKPNYFDIYPAGYSNNVFNEQIFSFNVNVDINIENYLQNTTTTTITRTRTISTTGTTIITTTGETTATGTTIITGITTGSTTTTGSTITTTGETITTTGIPITELYLFAEFIPDQNNTKKYTVWDSGGTSSIINYDTTSKVYSDVIKYTKDEFMIENYASQTHYIETQYDKNVLEWKYNPLIPLKLRYFSDSVSTANINDVSYEETSKIPYYALKENDLPLLDNGKRIWRDILPQGYIDPISGIGVDYPFINNRRYLFSSIILDIIPNLSISGSNTYNIFKELNFYDPNLIHTQPTDLNNIGKKC